MTSTVLDADNETDQAGRVRLYELRRRRLYRGPATAFPMITTTLLASAEEAEEVSILLDTPSDWETIGVSQVTSTRNTRTLGFDIGWFAASTTP